MGAVDRLRIIALIELISVAHGPGNGLLREAQVLLLLDRTACAGE